MGLFEVEFRRASRLYAKWTPVIGENYNCYQRKEANEQNPCVVAIVKKQLDVLRIKAQYNSNAMSQVIESDSRGYCMWSSWVRL